MSHPSCDCHVCGEKRSACGRSPGEPCGCDGGPITAPCRPPCRPPCEPYCPIPEPCPPPVPCRPPKPKPCRTLPDESERHGAAAKRHIPCPPPGKPCKPGGTKMESVLLQKIVSCERRTIPNLCAELVLEGLPCQAEPPFSLVAVQQSGAQPWWTPLNDHGPDHRMPIRVHIPLCCQVRDSCGKLYSAASVVEAEVTLRFRCPPSESWKHSIFIIPCVRLLAGECCSEDACFHARLEISLELYLLRPEPCMMRRPEPPCPELPLYPQPVRPNPPYWQ